MIVTVRSATGVGIDQAVSQVMARRGKALPVRLADEAPLAVAYVNHGRWIAACPFCNGAELGDPEDPRFFCLSCYNEAAGGQWIGLQFPGEKQDIEEALMQRSKVETRNWLPNETVIDLLAQTLEREEETPGFKKGGR